MPLFVKMTIITGGNRNNRQINHLRTAIQHSEREEQKRHFLFKSNKGLQCNTPNTDSRRPVQHIINVKDYSITVKKSTAYTYLKIEQIIQQKQTLQFAINSQMQTDAQPVFL